MSVEGIDVTHGSAPAAGGALANNEPFRTGRR